MDKQIQSQFTCSKCKKENVIIYNVKSVLCKSCYNQLHHDKKKSYASQKKWKDKNKNYWKDYWLIHRQIKYANVISNGE